MKRINRRSVAAAMGGLGVLAWLGGERQAGKGAAPLDHRFNLVEQSILRAVAELRTEIATQVGSLRGEFVSRVSSRFMALPISAMIP